MDLAWEWTEVEWLLENPVTSQAYVGRALARPRLWPLIQEYHFGTIYSIGLPNKEENNIIMLFQK